MKSWLVIAIAAALTGVTVDASSAQYDVIRSNIEYAEHNGSKLSGDLYRPKGVAKAPVVVAVHGGGWQNGTRDNWKLMAPYLAKKGIAVFAISYRLDKAESWELGTVPPFKILSTTSESYLNSGKNLEVEVKLRIPGSLPEMRREIQRLKFQRKKPRVLVRPDRQDLAVRCTGFPDSA